MRRLFAVALLALVALAGCGGGGSTNSSTTPTPGPTPHVTLTQACPKGQSFMGCSQTHQIAATFQRHLKLIKPQAVPPAKLTRAMFPDVSMWQGTVGWPSVRSWQQSHGWLPGGVFKMGEGTFHDPRASQNATALHSLHMWAVGYWFVRNVGCSTQASAIESSAHSLGVSVVAEDLEVPEARGYGACLTPALRRAGFKVIEYTAPGTNPGGVDTSAPLWIATYGSSFSAIWNPVIAWQCTDGQFGCRTFVPGVGFADVSQDFGLGALANGKPKPPPPPPDPFRLMSRTVRRFPDRVHGDEYHAAKGWKLKGCVNPVKRPVCVWTRKQLLDLSGRVWYVAHNWRDKHGNWHAWKHAHWSSNHLGIRFGIMWRELHQTR